MLTFLSTKEPCKPSELVAMTFDERDGLKGDRILSQGNPVVILGHGGLKMLKGVETLYNGELWAALKRLGKRRSSAHPYPEKKGLDIGSAVWHLSDRDWCPTHVRTLD
jgi:hypothetical protein